MGWIAFAQAAEGSPQSPTGGMLPLLVPVIIMFGVFYLLLIRPQRKQEKKRRAMLENLQKNDKVVTIGGIHGVVANIRPEDDVVTLKIDESGNVRIRMARSAISRVVAKEDEDSQE